jgi:hypothetical protein
MFFIWTVEDLYLEVESWPDHSFSSVEVLPILKHLNQSQAVV